MSPTPKAADPRSSPQRKPYAPPRLVSYGHVKDLIQGGGGMRSDSGAAVPGGNSKVCWIAEALYGVHDPRTTLVRAWLPGAAAHSRGWRCFCALYRTCGRTVAALIYRRFLPRQLFRPFFDMLVRRAFGDSARAIRAASH